MKPSRHFTHLFGLFILLISPNLLHAQSSASSKWARSDTSLASAQQSVVTPAATVKTYSATSAAPGITDHTDIAVYNQSPDQQSEVHISINPYAPNVLVCSFNTYIPSPKTYSQSHYISTTSGATWSGSDIYDPTYSNVGGDPSTAIDANGNMFISTIANIGNGYYLIESTNNSSFGSSIFGGGHTDFDKEMIAADNLLSSPYKNNLYAAWTEFSDPPTDVTPSVKFNRSTDGANNFSQPITLKSGPGQGTNVQTGPNGEVYVCYADYGAGPVIAFPAVGFGFVKSLDGGVTFTSPQVAVSYVGIRKQYTVNGKTTFEDPNFNYIRVNDFPSMSIDKSSQVHRGRIYVVFAAQENGNGKAVIQLSYSDNQGTTWSSPKTVSISNAT